MHVIVAGGGIGGLTCAVALRQAGIEVTVVEQAAALDEVGAGIQLSANGIAVLGRLGLEEALAATGIRPESFEFLDLETGELLVQLPVGDLHTERYGHRFYQLHRADLLDVLAGAVPTEVLRLGSRVAHVDQDAAGVDVKLASGEVLRGDALIGADGIHSAVRQQFHGAGDPVFAGLLSWRALIPEERLRPLGLERRCYIWSGPGRSIVSYWVRRGELHNFLGTVPATEVHRESWTDSGDISELIASFAGSEPRAAALVEAVDSAFITGLYYRDPLPEWGGGRVTLLGEAAHAMLPFLAQGACQAIEDSWILARLLAPCGPAEIPAAFRAYEQRRRPRTMKVQAAARAMVKQLHEPDRTQIRARNGRWRGMVQIDPASETVWGWLYAYNAITEADRPLDRVLGITPAYEGAQMARPESHRAFDQWRSAFSAEDIARGVTGLRDGYDRFLRTNFPAPDILEATPADVGGAKALWVTPPGEAPPLTLLHFHGGGYILGSAAASIDLAGRLAGAAGARALVVDYRLAPEHPYPAALDDALAAYRGLIAAGTDPRQVLLCGESAGGGLAVAVALALRAAGDPLPAGVVALSPFTDLTVRGPSIDEFAGLDPAASRELLVFFAGSYFQSHDPTDPGVSPLYGDFSGMPPLLVFAATGEVLVSDATRLAERARSAGVDVTLELADDSVHVYPLFDFLPETARAMEVLASFARRVTARP
ncbi:MAG: hypothetical protein QOJ23_621 [Actinomycetota bacterium]|nr:hypothetical protein [Actinomycetota bacterium]